MGARFPHYLKADSPKGRAKEQALAGKPQPPVETHGDIKQGFVYERVQHITLKSIANNPDIVQGMSREQIEAAIKRHADFEVLYDRPYEDKGKVRVTGRFTVESLSPHRALAFDRREAGANRESISELSAAADADGPNFEQSILDNLAKAGIQNGKRNERITFATLDAYLGSSCRGSGSGSPRPMSLPRKTYRAGSGSRSARSTAPSARRSSKPRPGKRLPPVMLISSPSSGSRLTHKQRKRLRRTA